MAVSQKRKKKQLLWCNLQVRPSKLSLKYGYVVEREETVVSRLWRETKCGKLLPAAWVFDVVLNSKSKNLTRSTCT